MFSILNVFFISFNNLNQSIPPIPETQFEEVFSKKNDTKKNLVYAMKKLSRKENSRVSSVVGASQLLKKLHCA